jgi:hypothetical protein
LKPFAKLRVSWFEALKDGVTMNGMTAANS